MFCGFYWWQMKGLCFTFRGNYTLKELKRQFSNNAKYTFKILTIYFQER